MSNRGTSDSSASEFTELELSLIRLIEKNPGPSLSEVYKFVPIYYCRGKLPPDLEIRKALIKLMVKKIIRPYLRIDIDHFFPMFFIITDKGKGIQINESYLGENMQLTAIAEREEDPLKNFPSINEMSDDEIRLLSDIYKYWGSLPLITKGSSKEYGDEDNLLYAAIVGYFTLKDERKLNEALILATDFYTRKDLLEFMAWSYDIRDILNSSLAERAKMYIIQYLKKIVEELSGILGEEHVDRDPEDVTELIRKIGIMSNKAGSYYKIVFDRSDFQKIEDFLVKFWNRTSSLIELSIRESNREAFHHVIELVYYLADLLDSMIKPTKPIQLFDDASGITARTSLLRYYSYIFERVSFVADINSSSLRNLFSEIVVKAYDNMMKIVIGPILQSLSYDKNFGFRLVISFLQTNYRYNLDKNTKIIRMNLKNLIDKVSDINDELKREDRREGSYEFDQIVLFIAKTLEEIERKQRINEEIYMLLHEILSDIRLVYELLIRSTNAQDEDELRNLMGNIEDLLLEIKNNMERMDPALSVNVGLPPLFLELSIPLSSLINKLKGNT